MAMAGKRPPVPDDTVFFSVFPDLVSDGYGDLDLGNGDGYGDSDLLRLQSDCLAIALPLVHGYIWQQPFALHPSTPHSPCPCSLRTVHDQLPAPPPPSLPLHLHGKLKYGDNVEDEWFVVYLLFAISRQLPALSIRVWDTDGEFLLIEAAYSIPRWLKPENSWNRVFKRQGCLHILPLPSSPAELYHLPVTLSVEEAIKVLSSGAVQTRAADSVQEAIQRRLRSFGENCKNNMHDVVCRVSLPVAQILKHEAQLVSLAVEAFYDRDLDSMKAASRMQQFLPNVQQTEMVDVKVRMSRAMYAQLTQQTFQAPRCYPMPPFSDPHYKEAELGMKLACGFEMMYWERGGFKSQVSDGESEASMQGEILSHKDVGWQAFVASLQQTGYFRGLLEGSKEYRELMDLARARYQQTSLFSRASTAINAPIRRIKEILALPHSMQEFVSSEELKSDDDLWLYQGEDDLKNAMLERQKEIDMYESERPRRRKPQLHANNDIGSSQTNETREDFNADEVAKSVHSFIDNISSFEGAELPGDDDETKDDDESLSIRMEKFMKELKSAFGSNVESLQSKKGEEFMDTSSSDMDFDDDDDESDILEDGQKEDLMAADSWSTSYQHNLTEESDPHKHRRGKNTFMKEYSDVLSRELHSSSLAKSFVQGTADEEELPSVNIDVNLLQNFLQSYSSQQGLPGPSSNLLGAMGLHLPDDKDKD